ncbi:decarboxylating 6-phosphogluconate dehydrogenase [Prosthecochloris sp. N3]|uniref:Decarboxylating 6-phosphogluconate dehydrogenase n=1 Tax=Prosthecochloris ethylica TaxID=2743976 RepID=A0ABR9XNU4_9CHLB|nr:MULTISPECIES: decarboxylating 6-phosphogluconate dehydrogenase [Prosthecochloris]MEC9487396.1 decarboxylating 6-phosphogluconate dehydrogenase [Prosthecochloris sp.]MBF0585728.1 decarboxylating 6-phosphogluconate dehydrogenase [Prosthecochloris ethylica]MBF0635638.1 decarboxylating 6-phosphogluconate dehydrogenase [Prosthecochloris ethylica]NUK46937.1 decarboxylating 6-phosphogluconate dehydrogenase [Prosthecochloris ethylica]RNA65432.1 decarboxylating 6-phosphogluconate dehydrogenase [Pros
MRIGFIGLGKMGMNMVENLLDHDHEVVAYDLSDELVSKAVSLGASAADSLETVVEGLEAPRVVWMMVPAGAAVDAVIGGLLPLLGDGDVLVDGGNSHYRDSMRRAETAEQAGVHYMDAGTSGGLEGARNGACMMIGGDAGVYRRLEPLLRDLCVADGYGYMGACGAGHYAKMVHNGIEYGMMQAIGEGFDLLESSPFDFRHDEVARVWANGSVIRGWLMDLARAAFEKDGSLGYLTGRIEDSGEGRWTVDAALDQQVSVPVIAEALFRRYRSRSENNFSDKVVAALRHEFGGHGFTPAS